MKALVQPVSIDEDSRRREHILNIILVLSLLCFIILGATMVWNWMTMGDSYEGIHPLAFGSIALLYVALLAMSKKGHGRSASFLLIAFEVMVTIYTGWQWGASLPATLLLTALVIVTASVLLGSTTGFIVTGSMIGALTVLGVHEAAVLNVPDWRYDEITATDVISYSAMFLFMSFIGWLSNREIDASLTRARTSEKLLEAERNALEKKVSERTAELIAVQANTVAGLERSASMGELSQGVFHDLIGPLSAVAISVEEISRMADIRKEGSDYGQNTRHMRDMVEKAVAASKRMRSYMESVRRHIGSEESREAGSTRQATEGVAKEGSADELVDVDKEIAMAKDILAYKARMANVIIYIGHGQRDSDTPEKCGLVPLKKRDPIMIIAQPIRIHQMLLNLMSNAIDACVADDCVGNGRAKDGSTGKARDKAVSVSVEKDSDVIRVIVADNGCGISTERLKTLLIRPRSTKLHGMGIGLTTVKSIVEKELGGFIEIKSTEDIGTTFIITIPVSSNENTRNDNMESGKRKTGLGKYRDSDTPHP
jgi:signal transduction histidine kinase